MGALNSPMGVGGGTLQLVGVCICQDGQGVLFGNFCARKGFLVFVPVRVWVSWCHPSRGIPFPGEYPPPPGQTRYTTTKPLPKFVTILWRARPTLPQDFYLCSPSLSHIFGCYIKRQGCLVRPADRGFTGDPTSLARENMITQRLSQLKTYWEGGIKITRTIP